MGRAKDIIINRIASDDANKFVRQYHYSGKIVNNSVLHFGAFLSGRLHGVLSYGGSIDKHKIVGLVSPSKWNEMLELNRMAFDEYLPRNAESRCISISIKLIEKYAPHIRWLLSYADATQCGDGTIYRASGFQLTGIKANTTILQWQGKVVADKTLNDTNYKRVGFSAGIAKKLGARPLSGFQLRYIYLIDKTCKINVPVLPFSAIEEAGAGMYKGKTKAAWAWQKI